MTDMAHPTLLEKTLALLDTSRLTLAEISEGADVGYHWLNKLAQRRISDPGVQRIERLHRFLSLENKTAAS